MNEPGPDRGHGAKRRLRANREEGRGPRPRPGQRCRRVVKAAQQRAAEIAAAAQTQAAHACVTTVTDYCENMLRTTEEALVRSMAGCKTVRANLRQSAKNG